MFEKLDDQENIAQAINRASSNFLELSNNKKMEDTVKVISDLELKLNRLMQSFPVSEVTKETFSAGEYI